MYLQSLCTRTVYSVHCSAQICISFGEDDALKVHDGMFPLYMWMSIWMISEGDPEYKAFMRELLFSQPDKPDLMGKLPYGRH